MRTLLLMLVGLVSSSSFGADVSEIFGRRNPLIVAVLKYEYVEVDAGDSVVEEAIKEAEYYFSLIFSKAISSLPKRYYVHKGSEGSADALKTEIDTPIGQVAIFQTSDFLFIQVPFLAQQTGASSPSEFVKTAVQALVNQDVGVESVKTASEGPTAGSVTLQNPLKVWIGEQSIILAGIKIAGISGQRPSKVVLLNDNGSQLTWFKRLAAVEAANLSKEEQRKEKEKEDAKRLGPEYEEIQRQIEERNARRKAEAESKLNKSLEQVAPVPSP